MDSPVSGDIFPARQAIDLIDQLDFSVPLDIPLVPLEAEPSHVPPKDHDWLLEETARLKKEKSAYILAHNYAPSDIQDVADAVGDSLYLAQKGAESDAEILLEASVFVYEPNPRDHEKAAPARLGPGSRRALFLGGSCRRR